MFGIGFGALRQMGETFKYNRDLLGKTKREPFERIDKKSPGRKTLSDDIQMTDADRLKLLASIKMYNKRARLQSVIILIFSVLATALLVLILRLFLVSW
jgi:hypothetical protein